MDHEQGGHACKVCGKRFPSGRSLGGHMRSHLPLPSSPGDVEKPPPNPKKHPRPAGYALRENPKKTWRLSLPNAGGERNVCAICFREFPSRRSLYGHLRCHKYERDAAPEEEEDEDEGSLSYNYSGSEVSAPKLTAIADSSSCVSDEDRELQEIAALSLIKLSQDTRPFYCSTSIVSAEEDSASVEKNSSKKPVQVIAGRTFQCASCKRVFPSYQALGGHKASHMRGNPCTSSAAVAEKAAPNAAGHICSICGKVFSSGQALGGHKRSHPVASSSGNHETNHDAKQQSGSITTELIAAAEQQSEPINAESFDLNLPAPGYKEDEPWWDDTEH